MKRKRPEGVRRSTKSPKVCSISPESRQICSPVQGWGGIVLWPLIYDFVLETGPSRKMRQARPCWSVDKEVGIFTGIEVKWVYGCIAC